MCVFSVEATIFTLNSLQANVKAIHNNIFFCIFKIIARDLIIEACINQKVLITYSQSHCSLCYLLDS